MTILVTGGAGFIGTHLCREMIGSGHEVLSLDLRSVPASPVTGVEYLTGDVRDGKKLIEIFRAHDVEAVYHLAATVSVPLCQKDTLESYSNNLTATHVVLEACRLNHKPVRFAFASSAALYGNLGDRLEPLKEEKIADRFSSFYAAQKHASEKLIQLYHDFYQVPALSFRFFNVYGQGQDPTSPYSGVITIFLRLAKENLPMILNGGGNQTRDFIPVKDVAHALSQSLKLPVSEWNAQVMNLGSGTSTSVRRLAEIIRDLSLSKSEIIVGPVREGDVMHSLADISQARPLLGLSSYPLLEDGLKQILNQDLS